MLLRWLHFMPRRKTLRSVARSIADSFTSGINYRDDDFVMGHLVAAAQRTGSSALEVDLLSGQSHPAELLSPPILQSIESYRRRFEDVVTRSQSDPGFVASAQMRIDFDLTKTKRSKSHGRGTPQSPYTCTVIIADDRGRKYSASVTGWWSPGLTRRDISLWSLIRNRWSAT